MQEVVHPEDPLLQSAEFSSVVADRGSALGSPRELFQRYLSQKVHPFNPEIQVNPDIFLTVNGGESQRFVKRIYYKFDPSNPHTQFPVSAVLAIDNLGDPEVNAVFRLNENDSGVSKLKLFPGERVECYFTRPYGKLSLSYDFDTGNIRSVIHRFDIDKGMILEGDNLRRLLSQQFASCGDTTLTYQFSSDDKLITVNVRPSNMMRSDIVQVPIKLDRDLVIAQLVRPQTMANQFDLSGQYDYSWRSANICELVGMDWQNLMPLRKKTFKTELI